MKFNNHLCRGGWLFQTRNFQTRQFKSGSKIQILYFENVFGRVDMKKICGVLCVFIVLFSTAVSVNASEQKNVEKEDSMSASAEWVKTTGDKTITYLLTATETGSEQDKISLLIYTEGPEYFAGKSGQVQVKDSAFKIDAKLNSASLSQVKVKISDSYTHIQEKKK